MAKIGDWELRQLLDENTVLWAIFKTCMGCKHAIPGIVYGCNMQQYIDLSGHCNQREDY